MNKYTDTSPCNNNNSRIKSAILNGHLNYLRGLTNNKHTDTIINYDDLFSYACEIGHANIVEYLLEFCDDPTANENLAFKNAIRGCHTKVVECLLSDKRLSPDFGYQFPIRFACFLGCYDMVRILLQDPRVDPTISDSTPFQVAAANGFLNIVLLLLNDGRINESSCGGYALRSASKSGYNEIVKVLLKKKGKKKYNI